MKILVIGSGGREHALVKAFRLSPLVTELHAIPGSDGMAHEAFCHPDISWKDFESVVQFCLRAEIDFVMVGPEDPLVEGLSDFLRQRGIHTVGPDKDAAQLEGSKIFAKQFMSEAGLPTAPYQVVDSVESTMEACQFFTPPYVLKADGLAAGKGVFICKTKDELKASATKLFVDKIFGSSGQRALLEQFMPGYELSYLILTNGYEYRSLPLAQDHKRLNDEDEGPNTGGMGTVAPVKIDKALHDRILKEIIEPTVRHLDSRQFIYRGIVFIGIMVTEKGPQILEYNVRFGDPETQVILPLLDTDVALLFASLAKGELLNFQTRNVSATCVVMSAEGYPDSPRKGDAITGPLQEEDNNHWVIHSGTKKSDGQFTTNGGRVLGCVGIGHDLNSSREEAYKLVERISWKGCHYRKDIGNKLK